MACAALIAVASAAAGTNGAWVGRLIDPGEQIPSSAYAKGTLVVGSTAATARFTNRTLAAHDSPSATSSCSMRFRFTKVVDGWRYYVEVGGPRLTSGSRSGGMPDLSMCSYSTIHGGGAIRIRPAGSKLRVEYTSYYRTAWDGAALAGFLTR